MASCARRMRSAIRAARPRLEGDGQEVVQRPAPDRRRTQRWSECHGERERAQRRLARSRRYASSSGSGSAERHRQAVRHDRIALRPAMRGSAWLRASAPHVVLGRDLRESRPAHAARRAGASSSTSVVEKVPPQARGRRPGRRSRSQDLSWCCSRTFRRRSSPRRSAWPSSSLRRASPGPLVAGAGAALGAAAAAGASATGASSPRRRWYRAGRAAAGACGGVAGLVRAAAGTPSMTPASPPRTARGATSFACTGCGSLRAARDEGAWRQSHPRTAAKVFEGQIRSHDVSPATGCFTAQRPSSGAGSLRGRRSRLPSLPPSRSTWSSSREAGQPDRGAERRAPSGPRASALST